MFTCALVGQNALERVAGATQASVLVITRSDYAARADKTTRRKGPRGRAAGVPWEPGVRIHKTNIKDRQ